MIQIKGIVFGLAMVLAISTTRGLLELLLYARRLPIIHVVTIFCFSYGPAVIFLTNRERKADA